MIENIQENQNILKKIIIGLLCLTWGLFAQNPPENLNATMVNDNSIDISWDPPINNYSVTAYIESIDDDGAGNLTLSIFMQNNQPVYGFNFTLTSTIGDIQITNADGGVSQALGFIVVPVGYNTVIGALPDGVESPIPPSDGNTLVILEATYDISNNGSIATLGQSVESVGFYGSNEQGLLLHRWHPIIWQVGIGMLSNPECSCDEEENYYTCPFDCDAPLVYNIFRDGNIIYSDLVSTAIIDTGLTPETDYCYTANAVNPFSISDLTEEECTQTDCITQAWYQDLDADGLGDSGEWEIACGYSAPEGFVDNDLDEYPDCPNVFGYDPYDCNNTCFNAISFNGEQMPLVEYENFKGNFCSTFPLESGCSIPDECGLCCEGTSGIECSYYNDESDFGGAYDCNNACNGSAYFDECEVCCDGTTGEVCSYFNDEFDFDGAYDCAAVCHGYSVADECQICNGDGSTCEPPTTPENVIATAIGESEIEVNWDASYVELTGADYENILAFVSDIEAFEDGSVLIELFMYNLEPISGFSITLQSHHDALIFSNTFGFGGTAEEAGMQVTINEGGHILAAVTDEDLDIPASNAILTKFWASYDNELFGVSDTLVRDTLNTAFASDDTPPEIIGHNWQETIWDVGIGLTQVGGCGDGICANNEIYADTDGSLLTCPSDCPPPITYDLYNYDQVEDNLLLIGTDLNQTLFNHSGLNPEQEYCYIVAATAQYTGNPKTSGYSDTECTSTLCELYTYYYDFDGDGLGDPENSIELCDLIAPEGYVNNGDDIYPLCFYNIYDCFNVCGGSAVLDIYGDCCDGSDLDECGECDGDGLNCEGISPPILTAIGGDDEISLIWTSVTGESEDLREMPLLVATVSDVQDNGEGNMVFEVSIDNSGAPLSGFSISFDIGDIDSDTMFVLESINPTLGGLAIDANLDMIVTDSNIFTQPSDEDTLIVGSGVLFYVTGNYNISAIGTNVLIDEGWQGSVFIDQWNQYISDEWLPTTWLLGYGLVDAGFCGDGFCEESENFDNCPEDCGGVITYTVYKLGNMIISGLEDTTYTDSDNLEPDIAYCYTVTATNQVVTSFPSNEACASIDCELNTYYSDIDGDGLGDPGDSIMACEQLPGYVDNGDDEYPNCFYNFYDCEGTCGGVLVEDINGMCCTPENIDNCGICYGSNDCEGGYCGDGICDDDENFENCPQDCEGDPEPGGPLNLEATGGDHQISLNWDEPVGLLSDRDESLQILVNNIIDDGAGNVILQLHMANSEPIVAFNFTIEPSEILTFTDVYGGSSSDAGMDVNMLLPTSLIVLESEIDEDIPPGYGVLMNIGATYNPALIGQNATITISDSPFNGFLNDNLEVVEFDWLPVTWVIGSDLNVGDLPDYCGNNECGPNEDHQSCPYDCNVLSYVVYSDGIVIEINLLETSYIHTGLGAGETHCYVVSAIIDGIVIQESNEACAITDANNLPVISLIEDQPNDDGGWVILNIESIYLDTEPVGNFYEIFRQYQGGEWFSVGTFGAYGWGEYFALAPTIADSTYEELNLHAFKLSYLGIESDVVYGYSVNNNPPDAPTGLELSNFENEVYLEWNLNSEPDFEYYNVYSRIFGLDWDETPDSTNIPFFIYSFPTQSMEYSVTAIDSTGNESEYSNVVSSEGGLLGDVNQDSSIDVLDIINVVYFILDLENPTSYQFWAGDMNDDDIMDILDIIILVNIILDDYLIRTEFIQEANIFVTSNNVSITGVGDIAGVQLEYSGDVKSIKSTLPDDWSMYYNENTILIFTTSELTLTNQKLFTYEGNIQINSNIVVGFDINPINAEIIVVPDNFILYTNYPNPFNPITNIRYALPYRSTVNISIFDIQGREIMLLLNEVMNPGEHQVRWNGDSFQSGVYFVRIQTEFNIQTQKIVLLK